MDFLTIEEAAEAVGVSRQTIWRACTKTKKLSFTKDENDVMRIDPSELTRVYKPTRAFMAKLTGTEPEVADDAAGIGEDATPETAGYGHRNSQLQSELKLLRERFEMKDQLQEDRLKLLHVRIEELLQDRDDLRAERDKLLTTMQEQALSVRLLTDQSVRQAQMPSEAPMPAAAVAGGGRRGFLGLFRR